MNRNISLLLLTLLLLAACGGENGVEVRDVWGRVSPQAASTGAFYMEITNSQEDADALVAVQTAACDTVELHESQLDENDVMRMRPVPGGQIPLPAGETVALQPGGRHVMCIGLNRPLTVDSRIPLTLQFANAGEISVEATIRTEAP